jgi:hypothetical protein
MDISHFKFIGECFVDGMVYGWRLPELEAREKIIVALH